MNAAPVARRVLDGTVVVELAGAVVVLVVGDVVGVPDGEVVVGELDEPLFGADPAVVVVEGAVVGPAALPRVMPSVRGAA